MTDVAGRRTDWPPVKKAIEDGKTIRLAANKSQIPCITPIASLNAMVLGLISIQTGEIDVHCLQDYIRLNQDPVSRSTEVPGADEDRQAV